MGSSLINPTLLWGHINRNVPLWVLFLVAWLLTLVFPLATLSPGMEMDNSYLFEAGWSTEYIGSLVGCAVAAVVSVCCAFEYLFNRSAALHAGRLPVSRSALFLSAYVAGLAPLLVIELLVFAIVAALTMAMPVIGIGHCITWLGLTVGFTFVFYNVCVLCALLSGTRTTTYYLFMLANVFIIFIELAVNMIAQTMLWGVVLSDQLRLIWTSPLFGMGHYVMGFFDWISINYPSNPGWGALGVYCLASIAMLAVAFVLNKRRNLEVAGDSFAVHATVLAAKSMGALTLAALVGIIYVIGVSSTSGASVLGLSQRAVLAAACFIGAFLGAFLAQAWFVRSGHAFKDSWKMGVGVGLVCVLLIVGCSADVLGIKRWVPAADDVTSVDVEINGQKTTLSTPENIAVVEEFHNKTLAFEEYGEDWSTFEFTQVDLSYEMKDGRTVRRKYPVISGGSALYSKNEGPTAASSIKNLYALKDACDSPEGIESRNAALFDASIDFLDIDFFYNNGEEREFELKGVKAQDFIQNALKPDLENTDLGKLYLPGSGTEDQLSLYASSEGDDSDYWDFNLSSENCPTIAKWMKKHYDVDVLKVPGKNSK